MRRLLSFLLYALMIAAGGAGLIAMFLNYHGLLSIRLVGVCLVLLSFGVYLVSIDFLEPVLSKRRARRRFHQALSKGQIDLRTVSLFAHNKLKPWDNQTLGLRALGYRIAGRFDDALVDFSEIIRLDPTSSNFISRGVTYLQKGSLDRALEDFNEAIRLDQNAVGAFLNRGLVYAAKGDRDRAIVEFECAITRDPKNVSAWCLCGATYAEKGDLIRATNNFNVAIDFDANHAAKFMSKIKAVSSQHWSSVINSEESTMLATILAKLAPLTSDGRRNTADMPPRR
jgi:Tfp pilus assembly protein PilF